MQLFSFSNKYSELYFASKKNSKLLNSIFIFNKDFFIVVLRVSSVETSLYSKTNLQSKLLRFFNSFLNIPCHRPSSIRRHTLLSYRHSTFFYIFPQPPNFYSIFQTFTQLDHITSNTFRVSMILCLLLNARK